MKLLINWRRTYVLKIGWNLSLKVATDTYTVEVLPKILYFSTLYRVGVGRKLRLVQSSRRKPKIESFWPQDDVTKSSSEEFLREIRGNSETRTLRSPKILKSKSSGYCLMPSVISTLCCRGKNYSVLGYKTVIKDNNQKSFLLCDIAFSYQSVK